MYFDLTLAITPEMIRIANHHEPISLNGHLGTHYDVMDKEFDLNNICLPAILFDVSHIRKRDIECHDIDIELIKEGMFVAFYTGFIEEVGYGNTTYFSTHMQLSERLIDGLLQKKVKMIGIDCAGIRRGKEHTSMDQYCANHGAFVIENMCHMKSVLEEDMHVICEMNTYPVNYTHMTGLPCRIVAKKN